MASDITHCLVKVDLYKQPHFFNLSSDEKLIYIHCLLQGAKNNMGFFREHRGSIAMFLRVDPDICSNFFVSNPDVIGFCPDTHLIWIKTFFVDTDFGLTKNIWYYEEDKNFNEVKKFNQSALYAKNLFISKVNATLKENLNCEITHKNIIFKNHPFVKEWVKRNYNLLDYINHEVKSIKGNGKNRNFDSLLSLVENVNI